MLLQVWRECRGPTVNETISRPPREGWGEPYAYIAPLPRRRAADFVILDKDPTRVDPSTIRDVAIRETRLNGERRFQACRRCRRCLPPG